MGSPRVSYWIASVAACLVASLGMSAHAETAPGSSGPSTGGSSPENGVFRFNVSPDGYPPYLIEEESRTTGIMWEVVTRIVDRLGYSVEAVKVPRKRVDQLLLGGMIDGTPRAKAWTDRPEDFLFTDPIVDIEEVIFFPANSPANFQVIEDLLSMTLVTHLGYHYPALEPYFQSGQIKRFDVPRDKDLFVYVLRGDEFDAAIADRLVGQWLLLKQGMQDQFRISSEVLSTSGLRLMLRPEWQSFARGFNRELATMRQNGEIDTILSRYR
jgi:polar amino acid transport system substrate-binding protein